MINFEWYRTFKAIYQTGTLTGAAKDLLISQPNVSQHLSSLEAYVGQTLFERQPRKMVPTYYGKLFYTQIIEAVGRLEDVETHFRRSCLDNHLALTTLGAPKEFFDAMLASRIGSAQTNIVVEFGVTKELMQRLVKGELNFVIATHLSEEKEVTFEPVLEEGFQLVGSPGLNTAAFEKLIAKNEPDKAEQWLYEQNWFAYSSDLMIIRRFWLRNFRKRPALRPRFIIPDFNSILKALGETTNGLTIASDYLVRDLLKAKKLKALWKHADPAANTLYLAYDKSRVTTVQIGMMKKLLNV
jgi:DNA-binding transcriptional LysR family regulator